MSNKKCGGVLYSLSFLAFLSLFLLSAGLDLASAAAQPKETCVTDKCHSNMGKDKFVHGPAATGDCVFCHKPVAKHKFAPIQNVAKLCYDCHDKVDTHKEVHTPVKEGKCTGCHDAHQSPNKFQLRAAGSDLCFTCHKKAIVGGKYVHGPVAVGGCSICHNPHSSDFPKMLMAKGNDACLSCHTDKADAFKGKKFTHAPVKESCMKCHDPHSGNYKYNFAADGSQDLCFKCHADKKKNIAEATVKHGGLETEKRCLACHDPHVSDYVKQLIAQPIDLCMQCHNREYAKGKKTVADMKELLAKNSVHHGPIKQKDCSSCHDTHGSSNFRILRAYFPDIFYSGYNPDNYKLCFMCHENTLAQDAKTTKLTNFRNGDQNLHFVHVNKTQKGRTCRACHDAHATNNPKHIRDAVPFGAWPLPVGFKKTDTGGACLPGCHQLFKYDRNNAVRNR